MWCRNRYLSGCTNGKDFLGEILSHIGWGLALGPLDETSRDFPVSLYIIPYTLPTHHPGSLMFPRWAQYSKLTNRHRDSAEILTGFELAPQVCCSFHSLIHNQTKRQRCKIMTNLSSFYDHFLTPIQPGLPHLINFYYHANYNNFFLFMSWKVLWELTRNYFKWSGNGINYPKTSCKPGILNWDPYDPLRVHVTVFLGNHATI